MKTTLSVIAAIAAVIALLYVATMPGAETEAEFTDTERMAIAEEIDGLFQGFLSRGRPEDADANFAMWSADADSYYMMEPAVFSQGYNIVKTQEDLRQFFDPTNWTRQSTNITTGQNTVAVLSPVSAVHVADGRFSITNMEGETGPERVMTMTSVWVKEADGWKVVHWHQSWNSDPIETEAEG